MEKYIEQLLDDITDATEYTNLAFEENEWDFHDWISDEEEDQSAPVHNLEEYTGISKEMLPPAEMLNEEQIRRLLKALTKMLDACNWSFVLQTEVPELIQYRAIRENFNQEIKLKRRHIGFFELCAPGTVHGKCAFGKYCQCTFYAGLFSNFIKEELSAEEERRRILEIEINHIKRKHGDDWMKYYPYHLDVNYDDENGNPHNYGFEDENEDDAW